MATEVVRGAIILGVGVVMGAALVAGALEAIDVGSAGAVLAAGIGVLLYLRRDRDS